MTVAQSSSPDLTNVPVAKWTQISTATFQNLVEAFPKNGGKCNSRGRLELEWDVQKSHASVRVRCLQPFSHAVYHHTHLNIVTNILEKLDYVCEINI